MTWTKPAKKNENKRTMATAGSNFKLAGKKNQLLKYICNSPKILDFTLVSLKTRADKSLQWQFKRREMLQTTNIHLCKWKQVNEANKLKNETKQNRIAAEGYLLRTPSPFRFTWTRRNFRLTEVRLMAYEWVVATWQWSKGLMPPREKNAHCLLTRRQRGRSQ